MEHKTDAPTPGLPPFTLDNKDFGVVLVCAVRYSLGRKTYMPSLVCDFITPLLPELSEQAIGCMERDIFEAAHAGYGLGDYCDKAEWSKLYKRLREVMAERAIEPWACRYRFSKEEDHL